jgi:hypothetical protein
MVEIEFELTLDDRLRFSEYHAEHSPSIRRSRFMYTGFSVVVFLVVGAWMYSELHSASVLVIFGMLALGSIWFCPWNWNRIMREKTRRLYMEGTREAVPQHYRIRMDADGLHISTDKGDSVIKWSAIERIVTSDAGLYLYTGAVDAISIPRRAFHGPDELERFADEVRAMREQAAGLTFIN